VWQVGQADDQIPTEIQLTANYRCSRTTLRKAVDELCHLRLLTRRAPHGTFVLPGAQDRARTLLRPGHGRSSAVDQ
jgi:DNA-binding GntR family transcriptional regulator